MNNRSATGDMQFWHDFTKWIFSPLLYIDLFRWLFVEIPKDVPYYFQWSKKYATREEGTTYRFFKYCLAYHLEKAALYVIGLALGFWVVRFLNIWPLVTLIVVSQAIKFFFNIVVGDSAAVANAFGWPADEKWGFAPLINAFFLSCIIEAVHIGSFGGFFQSIVK